MPTDPMTLLDAAAAVMKRAPLTKLVRPGVGRFAVRYLARLGKGPTVRTAPLFFGDRMEVVLPDVISESIHSYGFFDEVVTRYAMLSVRPGATVLDVGAHFGYFSLLFASLAGENGHVYAFEPTPSTFSVLARNTRGRSNVTAMNLGAANADGEARITDYGLRFAAWNHIGAQSRMPQVLNKVTGRSVAIRTVRLDDFLGERDIRPDFIKIDAENFEGEIVKGLEGTLRRCGPAILMETGSDASLSAAGTLLEMGYAPWGLAGGRSLAPIDGPIERVNAAHKDLLFRQRDGNGHRA